MQSKSGVASLSSLAEFKEKIAGDTPVLIDFWATWCGPCRVISPIFAKFAEKVKGVEFYTVDVDAQREIAQEVTVKAMPTFLLFKNGKRAGELVGAVPVKLEALVTLATSLVESPKVAEAPDASSSAKSGVETRSAEKPDTSVPAAEPTAEPTPKPVDSAPKDS